MEKDDQLNFWDRIDYNRWKTATILAIIFIIICIMIMKEIPISEVVKKITISISEEPITWYNQEFKQRDERDKKGEHENSAKFAKHDLLRNPESPEPGVVKFNPHLPDVEKYPDFAFEGKNKGDALPGPLALDVPFGEENLKDNFQISDIYNSNDDQFTNPQPPLPGPIDKERDKSKQYGLTGNFPNDERRKYNTFRWAHDFSGSKPRSENRIALQQLDFVADDLIEFIYNNEVAIDNVHKHTLGNSIKYTKTAFRFDGQIFELYLGANREKREVRAILINKSLMKDGVCPGVGVVLLEKERNKTKAQLLEATYMNEKIVCINMVEKNVNNDQVNHYVNILLSWANTLSR